MAKKALVLLNTGAARNKDELEVFLTNIFNNKRIIPIGNDTARSMTASLFLTLSLEKMWNNKVSSFTTRILYYICYVIYLSFFTNSSGKN